MAIALKIKIRSFIRVLGIMPLIKRIMLMLFSMLESALIAIIKRSIPLSAGAKKKLMNGSATRRLALESFKIKLISIVLTGFQLGKMNYTQEVFISMQVNLLMWGIDSEQTFSKGEITGGYSAKKRKKPSSILNFIIKTLITLTLVTLY